ncbi:MAG: hypothetical protein P8M13_06310 [Luminiphilus sp.]|nr:hypothetical protein [Luminiphilus sp.]
MEVTSFVWLAIAVVCVAWPIMEMRRYPKVSAEDREKRKEWAHKQVLKEIAETYAEIERDKAKRSL